MFGGDDAVDALDAMGAMGAMGAMDAMDAMDDELGEVVGVAHPATASSVPPRRPREAGFKARRDGVFDVLMESTVPGNRGWRQSGIQTA
jgi:hypothetical protein